MNTSDENEFQVVVAGAGPVGMAVAIELGLRGIRTLVCDPRGPVEYNVARINLTNARSMEHFRRWGIADKLRENDPIPSDVVRDLTYVTRANGRIILNVEGAYEWREQPSFAAEVPEWAPHHAIEKTLREKILSIPAVTFMPFTTIKDFTQDSEGVTLTYEDQSGTKTVPSQYFIIADGAQSEFRRKLNLRMEGETLFYNQAWYFRAPDLAKLFARTQLSSMTFFLNEDCYGDILIPQTAEGHWLYHVTPMPEGVEADDWPTFRNMLYRSIGEEFEVFEPQGRYFGSQVRLAASFNFGRALLIGDAAHLTSPFGGFGMNMGIGDAVDAGWKIAAILQGWGGPRLLETYTLERRDVCKYIIEGAAHNNKVSGKALVRPYMEEDSERGEKAREEVREFIIREKTQQSRSFGAQFGYRYTSSPIVVGDGTELPPLQYGEYTPSSVAGCRAPHLWLSEGNSIYDHFGPDFCLLKLDPAVDTTALEAAAAEVGIPLKVFLLDSDEARSLYERKLVLIRPDQHVAWRGNAEPDDCRWLVDVVRGAASFH